jgi:hypothetical protein
MVKNPLSESANVQAARRLTLLQFLVLAEAVKALPTVLPVPGAAMLVDTMLPEMGEVDVVVGELVALGYLERVAESVSQYERFAWYRLTTCGMAVFGVALVLESVQREEVRDAKSVE